MEHALLALKGPSNIEKKVRELQSSLYRQVGLISALALPVMIPLCFVEPGSLPANRSELRDSLRRAAGREAPYLNSGSVAESAGYLFWDLTPRRELQRLRRSCEKVFAPEVGGQADQPAARQGVRQQDPFPVARGFFLCSLEGRSRDTIPSLTLSEPLRFPATALLLLRFHPLGVEPVTTEPRPSPTDARPWWKSLFWEKLEEIPLRKSATTG